MAEAPAGLPPAVQLKHSYKINHDGTQDSGPLVADDRGIGVEVVVKKEKVSAFKVRSWKKRFYILYWDQATGYQISSPAAHMVGGSTVNSRDLNFTVTTASNQHSFLLHGFSEQTLRNQLGRWLAKIENRAR